MDTTPDSSDSKRGEPSWESLKACKRTGLFCRKYVTPNLVLPQHELGRWESAIPAGVKLVYRHSADEAYSAPYLGKGKVNDGTLGGVAFSTWCAAMADKKLGPSPNGPRHISGPQTTSVMVEDVRTGEKFFVKVKAFDYATIETLIADGGPLEWVYYSHSQRADVSPFFAAAAATEATPEPRVFKRPPQSRDEGEDGSWKRQATDVVIASHWYPVAYDGTVDMKDYVLNNTLKRTVWQTIYGAVGQARCIMCEEYEIQFCRAERDLSHVFARGCGGRNDKTYNYLYLCSSCNLSCATRTIFDQLARSGRLHRVVVIAEVLLKLYCRSEPVNYQFLGRCDFVRRVYGDGMRIAGGICDQAVFDLLNEADMVDPLPPVMLNPLLRAVNGL